MKRHLMLVHGRAQQNKEAAALKAEWVEALSEGLRRSGLSLPIPEEMIHFPFYGDTLAQMDQGKSADEAAEVILRGDIGGAEEEGFARAFVDRVQEQLSLSDEQIADVLGTEVLTRGVPNWEWVQGVLAVIDRGIPFASGASIALFTHDVYSYLSNSAIREHIDVSVSAPLGDAEVVIVSHSLGTVVSYNLLRTRGDILHWRVPQFITLGSPLAVKEIQRVLRRIAPLRCPSCVNRWFNAMDERDVIALYALEPPWFVLDASSLPIDNKRDVRNRTENRHGIVGYLEDQDVAKRIYDALVQDA